MSIPPGQVDALSAVVQAALGEFGDELHVETARLHRAALHRDPPRPEEGGFACLQLRPPEPRQ